MLRALGVLVLAAAVTACSSGSTDQNRVGSTEPPREPPEQPVVPPRPSFSAEKAEAFRFLNQATFGATEAAAEEVMDVGVEAWIEAQLARPASLQLPHLQSLPRPEPVGPLNAERVDVWFRHALNGPDQLRQRVAFALSEILVVSEIGTLRGAPYALASYYDLLAQHAFGNFRDLLEAVTLHPAMGTYLSMLGNEKPDAARNIRPDENFARELMQLFTIGLVELGIDGTPKLDGEEEPIPTYSQEVIEGFAHVFTGWHYADAESFRRARRTDDNQVVPMQLYPEFHDTGPKLLLGGVTLPAGQSGEEDLDAALDNLFDHPNVGPFVARRMIQRLVTSNPSPEYVARVARRFNDDGAGVRGELGAVVKAVLLDPEARPEETSGRTGKLKEPLLRVTQLWRAYDGRAANGSYAAEWWRLDDRFGQGPLQAHSVFNFFSPFYAPPGEIRADGLVAPELEIATEYQNTVLTNFLFRQSTRFNSRSSAPEPADVVIDVDSEAAIADDAPALVGRVAEKLLGGAISVSLWDETVKLVSEIPSEDGGARAGEAIYLIVTSPEYAVQR